MKMDVVEKFHDMSLQLECRKQVLAQLSPENCLGMWNLSKSLPSKEFTHQIKEYILEHFDYVSKCREFLDLDLSDLVEIVRDDNLKTAREENVATTVLSWICHCLEVRKDSMYDVLRFVRFPLMRPEYLLDLEEEYSFLFEDAKCKKILFEAIRYRMLGGRRQEITSSRTLHRNCSPYTNVIVAVGSDGSCAVTEYKPSGERPAKWSNIKPLPFIPGYFFGVCTFLDDIYVAGGLRFNGNHCAKYNSEQNNWTLCSKMLTPRARHAMVAVTRGIFVIGGSTPTNEYTPAVDKYDISRQKWVHFGDLLIPVRSMSAAVLKENIYVFGGKEQNGEVSATIQSFHCQTAQCTIVGCLLQPVSLSSAIPVDGAIYIVSHDGSIMIFSPKEQENVSEVGKFSDFEMKAISLICFENTLYATEKIPSKDKDKTSNIMKTCKISKDKESRHVDVEVFQNRDKYIEFFKYTIPKKHIK